MIAPHVILTAARCFLPFSAFGVHDGPVDDLTINYYDPESGRRQVFSGSASWHAHPSFPGYTLATGLLNEAKKAKNDPKRWRRLMKAALASWFAHLKHPGHSVDPFALIDNGETSKDDLAVIVVPEVLGSLDGWSTDYHDYLRIYTDDPNNLNNGPQKAYGAGFTDREGHSDDQLRYGAFNTVVKEGDYLKLEGLNNPDLSMCRGDNGGPFEYDVTVGGQAVAMVAGVWSNFNEGTNGYCAAGNHGVDDSYACLLKEPRIQWVESVTGLSCASQSGGSHTYRRCFELPFIEDVPGEGLYEPHVATAIAMAAIW